NLLALGHFFALTKSLFSLAYRSGTSPGLILGGGTDSGVRKYSSQRKSHDFRPNRSAPPSLARGDALFRTDSDNLVAAVSGLLGTGLAGECGLHGSRELGDRHRRRVEVRLPSDVGPVDVQPDGDPAANPRHPVGGGDWQGSSSGLSRELS